MNFGGMMGGGAAPGVPQQPSQQSQLMMAKVEMASYADLFERLSRVCFQKCKFKYNDGQLNVGEMSCIDRCAGKYMQAYSSLGVKMAQVEKEIMDQAGASAGVQQ
ncbi:Mitochondrial Protein Translocase [Phytophthora megakarya]|uniref:Mitochondrial import inner membrane translocase subunit n=1 Tax=Phytophthora megakarya TaxID=4795 RepID=A0A225WRL8_9STRA|nr:Mitochondrial Protein Translocase [Phytophthora megakarya]